MSHLQARLVFVTRYRRGVFDDAMLTDCEHAIRQVCADLRAELAEFHGGPDHVHLLVRYPPTVARSRLVNSLKGVCSRRLRAQYADNSCPRVDRAGTRGHLWAPVGTCGRRHTWPRPAAGAPLEIVKEYIRGHQRPG